jgi:hypothetical protein
MMLLLLFVMWAVLIVATILIGIALVMETVIPETTLTTSKVYDTTAKILFNSAGCLYVIALAMGLARFIILGVT